MDINKITLSSPINEKITWAESCYENLRDKFLKDEATVNYLIRLKNAINSSDKEMAKTGILEICRKCEKDEGGSCCGAGLENKYDRGLLLVNLLLGIKLPKNRYDTKSCFFLGEGGCLLKARHVICVNYLCKKITDQIDPHKVSVLREKEGIELYALFILNERLKKIQNARKYI